MTCSQLTGGLSEVVSPDRGASVEFVRHIVCHLGPLDFPNCRQGQEGNVWVRFTLQLHCIKQTDFGIDLCLDPIVNLYGLIEVVEALNTHDEIAQCVEASPLGNAD